MRFDTIIAGAGITGLTLAERLANECAENVLVVEKRDHIGGNCHDFHDPHGILIHKYGPHIFHTRFKEVWDYLSRFTQWRHYQHKVLASVDGRLVPFPVNANTINMLNGTHLPNRQIQRYLDSVREKDRAIQTSEDVVIASAGRDLYEKFYKYYTKKQWDLWPDALDPSVISRVAIRSDRDDRYFTDKYQGMPKHGYAPMFDKMAGHDRVRIMLNTDYKDVIRSVDHRRLICTAPIDLHYDHRFGPLKYRSIALRFETLEQQSYQLAAVVNYPNDHDFTRITEYKKLTGQRHPKTTISYEYPTWEGEPYYPVPMKEQHDLYEKYRQLAGMEQNVFFAGRLGSYRYLNMDMAVKEALDLFEKIKSI
jgi:UDP-galactopyranose mutase